MNKTKNKYCDNFLGWALSERNLSWSGYRKVRGQVCKRIKRRIEELGLEGYSHYRQYLEENAEEWKVFDRMARITISRFFRDRAVWHSLGETLLPLIVEKSLKEERKTRCWSAGSASGEEPYSLAILWKNRIQPRFPDAIPEIVATDADCHMIKRAEKGCYSLGSLKELPEEWIRDAFTTEESAYCLKDSYKEMVRFYPQDIREEMPGGKFDLVFCKNLVSMYFKKELAVSVFSNMIRKMRKGALLILGNHEQFPLDEIKEISPFDKNLNIYFKNRA